MEPPGPKRERFPNIHAFFPSIRSAENRRNRFQLGFEPFARGIRLRSQSYARLGTALDRQDEEHVLVAGQEPPQAEIQQPPLAPHFFWALFV